MIEGLRLLPWLQERIRNNRDSVERYLDCEACMGIKESDLVRPSTTIQRQYWGCPFEKPLRIGERTAAWAHPGYRDETPTACVGYTTKLPEVHEIARARMHAKNNMFTAFVTDEPTENLLMGIEILEGADNAATCWREPESK